MIEKKPKELRSLFKVLEKKTKWALEEIYPLSYKIQSIFSSEQEDFRESISNKKLVNILSKVEEPYSFLRLSNKEKQKIQNKIDVLKKEKDNYLQEKENLERNFKSLERSIDFLENNFVVMLDRLEYIVELVENDFIDFVNRMKLETEKFFAGKTFDDYPYYFNMLVITNRVLEMLLFINGNIKRPNYDFVDKIDEWLFSIINFICTEGFLEKDLEEEYEKDSIVEEVNHNIEKIKDEKVGIKTKLVSLNKKNYVDYWIESMEETMLDIEERQKSIDLEVEELEESLDEQQDKIDRGLHLRRAFWKDILENYEDYPDFVFEKLENLEYGRYGNWLVSLVEYITSIRVEKILNRNHELFKGLKELYDESVEVYKRAKRNWNKNKNDSNAVALRRSKMYPVEISEKNINYLSRLKDLISNIEDVDKYLEQTNLFYEENNKLSLKIYRGLENKLEKWKDVFRDMFRGSEVE